MDYEIITKKIGKTYCRILRPFEYEELRAVIPKDIYVDLVDLLLFSGMRYNEVEMLWETPELFHKSTGHIHIESTKPKARIKDRYIKLNSYGKNAVRNFLREDKRKQLVEWPPARSNFHTDLLYWMAKANLPTTAFSMKSFRKTWGSWLCEAHAEKVLKICLSMGHTSTVALDHYLELPFSEEDKKKIAEYTRGWGD